MEGEVKAEIKYMNSMFLIVFAKFEGIGSQYWQVTSDAKRV